MRTHKGVVFENLIPEFWLQDVLVDGGNERLVFTVEFKTQCRILQLAGPMKPVTEFVESLRALQTWRNKNRNRHCVAGSNPARHYREQNRVLNCHDVLRSRERKRVVIPHFRFAEEITEVGIATSAKGTFNC